MDSLAAGLMGMQQGKLQFEVGVRVAAKAMDVARDQGDAMVGMVKVMAAGQKSLEKGIEGALKSLDVYA